MITADLDIGARCERHVGEAFRVRCSDCDREHAASVRGYAAAHGTPGTVCARHAGYVYNYPTGECARCTREVEDSA